MSNKSTDLIRLMSNENPFGPSPKALEALNTFSKNIHCYPNWAPETLKEKLAINNKVSPSNIAVSAGSYELINLITRFLVNRNEEILTFDNTFMAYSYSAKRNGRKCTIVNMSSYDCELDDLIHNCGNNTKAIFFANPNNPTGTIASHNSLRKLLETIPKNVFIISDEAYVEYVTDSSFPRSVELQSEFPNLIILRTFSKIYGMAGIRIGYGIAAEEIVEKLEKYRLLRSINSLAEQAAIAALDDVDYIKQSALHNNQERKYLTRELITLGFTVVPSQANFIYLPFDDNNKKNEIHKMLVEKGIMTCDLEIFGHSNGLRISIGLQEDNRYLIDCLRAAL